MASIQLPLSFNASPDMVLGYYLSPLSLSRKNDLQWFSIEAIFQPSALRSGKQSHYSFLDRLGSLKNATLRLLLDGSRYLSSGCFGIPPSDCFGLLSVRPAAAPPTAPGAVHDRSLT